MIMERRSAQMPRKRVTKEQIAFALRQVEHGGQPFGTAA
jgi:hypothetical protein